MVVGGDKISSAWANALDSKISNHSPFTYLVYFSNPTYYAVPYYDGGTTFSGPVLLTVMQNAINSLPVTSCIVYLRDLDEPAGLTIPANVMLVSLYAGSTVGGASTKALLLDQLRFGTWIETSGGNNSQILEIQTHRTNYGTKICVKPNGTPGGEWTTLLALWNLYNLGTAEELMEFSWSNNVFLINSFATGTGTPRDVAFAIQAGAPGVYDYMRAVYNAGDPYVKIFAAQLGEASGTNDRRVRVPNATGLYWLDTGGLYKTKIYTHTDDVWVFEHLKLEDIKFSSDTDGSDIWFMKSGGDFQVTVQGKGVVLTNAAGTVTKRVRLNDAGDGLIFEAV